MIKFENYMQSGKGMTVDQVGRYQSSISIFKGEFEDEEDRNKRRKSLVDRFHLFDHQVTGVEFLQSKKKVILADEMGLGKTRQAIVAAGESETQCVLIVCPASLKINWKREIMAMYSDARVSILSTTERDPALGSGWYILNYDILEKKMDTIEGLLQRGLSTLILDEAHYIKGKSRRSAAVIGGTYTPKGGERKKFQGIVSRVENVYCLTGTPLLNRPVELFNLLRAIGHPISTNRAEFVKRYCGAYFMVRVQDLVTQRAFIVEQKKAYTYYGDKTKYRHIFRFLDESGSSNIPELTDKIRASMLRRKKDQVLDLPEKIVSVMECEFSPEWKRAYESAFDSYVEWIKNNPDPKRDLENVLSARDLVEMGKMKQVCSLSKVERMVSDIESATEEGQKVIVFSQYMETIKTIEAQLRAKGIGCVTLTGESGMNERQDAVDAFQENEKIKVFIANIKAGGVGITLTAASIVMFADLEWSPEVHAQAEDRAHRYGQEGTVNVYYYIQPETIEVENMGILEDKAELIQAILEGQNAPRKGRNGVSEYMKALAQKVTNRAG